MTTQNEFAEENKFVTTILPWLVAAAALILYLLTLNHWISLGSLPYVMRATGQSWMPELTAGVYGAFGPNGPLLFLVTYPMRWLPEAQVPLAMNLFSMICAVLVVALLARSVALLPHDRTHDQREREHYGIGLFSLRTGWIPPVLAACVCGLQLTFWENATAMSGEMFDLLLVAYLIRCLLEYRVEEKDSWLYRAALVYGAAMTGNWLLVGLLPGFIAALLWIRGISFFNLRFLGWMTLCGAAGLLLYLLLPVIYVFSGGATAGFWQALKANLVLQKSLVMFVFRIPNNYLLLLVLTSFLPIVLISIRWASHFGDPSPLGTALTTGVFHLAHATLLVACVWVAFDPRFSPRFISLSAIPPVYYLSPVLYYLSALSVGYLSGYFLLVFVPLQKRMHQQAFWLPLLNRATQTVIWALLLLVPVGLIYKNLPRIQLTNGQALKEYAALLANHLPERSAVLSDDPNKLFLARAGMAGKAKAKGCLFLDTQALSNPEYHRFLSQRYPGTWEMPAEMKIDQVVPDVYLVNVIAKLSKSRPLYYLHPSFGYYFEYFNPLPHGMVCELKMISTNSALTELLSDGEVAENESFWNEIAPSLQGLIPYISEPPPGKSTEMRQLLMEKLRIPYEPSATALTLGAFYSQGLDFWGVQLQKLGRLKEAGERFDTSLALNPNNIAAKFNLQFNKDLQAGQPPAAPVLRSLEGEFGRYRDLQQVMQATGPFDEPTHCFIQALTFAQGGLLRQAAQQFERVSQLVPDYVPARFWLARILVGMGFPDRALDLIAQIRAQPEALDGTGIRNLELGQTEAVAFLSAKKFTEGERVLQDLMAKNPKDPDTLAMVFQISTMFSRYTNALSSVERQLVLKPNDTTALVNQGYLNLQISNYVAAIPPLTRALTLETNNYTALLDRAIAYLRSDQLEESQADYSALLKVYPNEFRVYYGLGEIAWRRNDTNAAVHNYELFLANSKPDTEEAKAITERLKALKPSPPEP